MPGSMVTMQFIDIVEMSIAFMLILFESICKNWKLDDFKKHGTSQCTHKNMHTKQAI